MLVISTHSDTGFKSHRLAKLPGGIVEGHLDNFAGVHATMLAYFSGRMSQDYVRIELTYGEEIGCIGAQEVYDTLDPSDLVVVVDVTGTPTEKDFCIEKCAHPILRRFLKECLAGMSYDLYENCPDPVSTCDEVDIYVEKCPATFFLGVPVQGGDYNAGIVRCREKSLHAIADALCRIAESYHQFSGS